MAKFKYVAKTQEGKTIKEDIEIGSKEELIANLRAQGLFIVSVTPFLDKQPRQIFSGFLKRTKKRSSIKLYDLTSLARNLAITLSAGVALLRSLEIIASQTESANLERILKSCIKDVKEGSSLHEAISKYTIFSYLWRGIIEIGETSGNLPQVLEHLADYLEKRLDFERKVISALIYPSILLTAAIGAMIVFFKVILPKFSSLFSQFNVNLPLATKILFNISGFVSTNFWILLIVLIIIGVSINYFFKSPETRSLRDKWLFKVPAIGSLLYLFCFERLSAMLYILLDSGLTLVYTLEITARGVGNTVFEKLIIGVKDKVRSGSTLSSEFAKIESFPLLLSEMSKIGEETGTMPEIFHKVSQYYQKELSTRIDRILAAFEPLMIAFVGVIIGGIVVSLFLPLFQIVTFSGGTF